MDFILNGDLLPSDKNILVTDINDEDMKLIDHDLKNTSGRNYLVIDFSEEETRKFDEYISQVLEKILSTKTLKDKMNYEEYKNVSKKIYEIKKAIREIDIDKKILSELKEELEVLKVQHSILKNELDDIFYEINKMYINKAFSYIEWKIKLQKKLLNKQELPLFLKNYLDCKTVGKPLENFNCICERTIFDPIIGEDKHKKTLIYYTNVQALGKGVLSSCFVDCMLDNNRFRAVALTTKDSLNKQMNLLGNKLTEEDYEIYSFLNLKHFQYMIS